MNRRGFTIVELLIVIVVIAILAAITIVAFNGIQDRAKASSAQSAASQSTKKVLSYAVENADQYPATLAAAGVTNSGDTSYEYTVNNTTRTFCITTTTDDVSYYTSNTQSAPVSGGCFGHSVGGVEYVTNLVPNPLPSVAGAWTPSGSTGVVTYTTDIDGLPSVRSTLSSTSAYALYYQRYEGGIATAQEGDTYTILAKLRSNAPLSILVSMGLVPGTGTIAATQITVPLVASTTYELRHTFTIPSGYDGQAISPKFWVAGDATYWFSVSEVMIVEGDYDGAYGDGNSPGWSWLGTSGNSVSSGPTQ